jgi:hypothetical protein
MWPWGFRGDSLPLRIPGVPLNKGSYEMRNIALEYMIKSLIEDKRVKHHELTSGMAFREVLKDWPELIKKIDSETQASLDSELRASLLSELVELKLKEKKELTYGMAFSEVQKENPGLTLLYQSDIAKGR